MKRTYNKLLCLLLALCMLLCTVACQEQEPPVDTEIPDEQPSTPVVAPTPTEIELSAKYVLIRPEERNDDEVKAVQLLWRVLGELYGEKFSMETDYRGKDDTGENAEAFEILVGETNRQASQDVLATLSYNDWTYRVISEHTVVICGGSPAATYAATCAFLKDMLGYQESESGEVLSAGAAAALPIGASLDYRHQYAITSFTLGAHELSEYSIVNSTKSGSKEAAQKIVDHFVNLTGIELPVLTLNAYKKGEGGPAIFIGCRDEDDLHLNVKPYSSDRYYICAIDDDIILDFKDSAVAASAAKRLIELCTPKADTTGSMTVSIPTDLSLTGLHIPQGTNSLVLDSSTLTEMAPGVVYQERLYYDPNGKPVRAYIMTVEKGAATIATSLPGDVEKIGTYATVLEQVKSAAEHGKKVIAGINADFFGNTMEGLCIRDGVELHDYSGRPWFGITKDGEPVLGTPEEFAKYQGKLMTGVGGSNVVINNDYVSHISVDHEFGYTRHPRTAVGITADGTTVLLVVDGRQSKISNGAALADLADILGSMGCIEALNLDGGGSCTFVLATENGDFAVKNSPSDGSLRDVADGLMVVLP
ncbi:MAG: phosphodiester glycosidase family protein [Clostridia bacterium]|nr:phosphodiester glycosidase family protein [Clostridia bacterium]